MESYKNAQEKIKTFFLRGDVMIIVTVIIHNYLFRFTVYEGVVNNNKAQLIETEKITVFLQIFSIVCFVVVVYTIGKITKHSCAEH